MAFTNLFRRYSASSEIPSVNYSYSDQNSVAETLLDELESQCRSCSSLLALKTRQSPQSFTGASDSTKFESTYVAKRHSSVDYSWLTPNKNLLSTNNELYQLPDMIKMELSELIRNVLAEDCTLIINQFRRDIRVQTRAQTPECVIALFRKTIAEYLEERSKTRTNTNNNNNNNNNSNIINHSKCSTSISVFNRNNRINPKYQPDDEQHCIAELTEISISSSSNDGLDNQTKSHY